MADFSDEFLAGWRLARALWQRTGSVQPHPPGYYDEPEPAPSAPAAPSGPSIGDFSEENHDG